MRSKQERNKNNLLIVYQGDKQKVRVYDEA